MINNTVAHFLSKCDALLLADRLQHLQDLKTHQWYESVMGVVASNALWRTSSLVGAGTRTNKQRD
jgi:hypothetical protein